MARQPIISERARMLVKALSDSTFDCGEWTEGAELDYPTVHQVQVAAEAKLLVYIARLESLANVAGAVVHQLTAGEASEGDARDVKTCAGMLRRELRRIRR